MKQRHRPGRPKRLSLKKQRHLGQLARSCAGATSFEIADSLNNTYPNLNIAPRTVRENLWKLGYQVCIPIKTPFLTPLAKERRVSWAKAHRNKRWGNVVFSDKTTIQMFRNTTLVRYKEGEENQLVELSNTRSKFMFGELFVRKGLLGSTCSLKIWMGSYIVIF